MPEAVGICHGHRPSHGAEPQVGQRSLFDDTPNLLCVSELHVNRQRVIEGAILSFLDTAFASQASPDTCWNRQLSPSQQGVEGNAVNKRARSKVSHSAFCHRCPYANRPKWEIPVLGHTADGLGFVSYILHSSILPPITPSWEIVTSTDRLEFVRNLGWSRPCACYQR